MSLGAVTSVAADHRRGGGGVPLSAAYDLPPAYDLHRSENAAVGKSRDRRPASSWGGGRGGGLPSSTMPPPDDMNGFGSFASASSSRYTTEDSLEDSYSYLGGYDDETTHLNSSAASLSTSPCRGGGGDVVREDDGGGGSSVMDFFPDNTRRDMTMTRNDDGGNNNNHEAITTTTTTTASNYLSSMDDNDEGRSTTVVEDVTTIIRRNYHTLLTILSNPESFTESMEWQMKLDAGIDPSIIHDENNDEQQQQQQHDTTSNISFPSVNFDNDGSNCGGGGGGGGATEEEDEDSTFKGLDDGTTTKYDNNNSNNNNNNNGATGNNNALMISSTNESFAFEAGAVDRTAGNNNNALVGSSTTNESFAFDPFGTDDDVVQQQQQQQVSSATTTTQKMKKGAPTTTARMSAIQPPLPHVIFASDAEVVLPQALTATQLFGIERSTGIELEAASSMIPLCQLFLRWLAVMPHGDHMNIVNPPGLTIMRISRGGYRVTCAHRVVWRWMNKFSPLSSSLPTATCTSTKTSNISSIYSGANIDSSTTSAATTTNSTNGGGAACDFDFGDLVTMTIVDVFETDVDGKLLSYCPTFDNRDVRKTPEHIEMLIKGMGQMRERMDGVAKSPVGKVRMNENREVKD